MSQLTTFRNATRVSAIFRVGWQVASRRLRTAVAGVRLAWRRSLQFRMVAITLLASGLLVGVFGVLVAQRSVDILVEGAAADVQAQLRGGVDYARDQLSVHGQPADFGIPDTLNNTVNNLSGRPEQVRGVVVAFDARYAGRSEVVASPRLDVRPLIGAALADTVTGGRFARQIRTADLTGRGTVKYLVFGAPVPNRFGQVQLYYAVPLTTSDMVAGQLQTTVAVTCVALVILLAVLAGLVTRLVVKPVRIAARTAQRLSAGLLDQRMVVHGEDDLALLAASFNQMAANLQRQISRLEEMSRLQRRFTSDVSHELRTPLTTVRMAADLIHAGRDTLDPVVARSAELLHTELDRFESLLTDLLEISRFDAGFAVLDAEPTNLVAVVQRAVAGCQALADRVGIPVAVRLPDAPVIGDADPRRVERIVRNLIGNAIEHAEGGPVEVTLVADESAVAIAVRDHGIGLRPGEEKLVFNRFWRADPSRARQTGGTGLGLSISLEDARLHGGWLEAWGVPGQGAQFRLTLPLRAGDRLVASPLRLTPPNPVSDRAAAPAAGSTVPPAAGPTVPPVAGSVRAPAAGRAPAGPGRSDVRPGPAPVEPESRR